MNKEQFINYCKKKGYDRNSFDLFKRSYDLARDEFSTQKRIKGDSVFDHNLRVACILVDSKAAPEVVVTGLLHGMKPIDLTKLGKEIVALSKGVSEVKELKSRNRKLSAQALRKILLTTLQDVRVILVKLAIKLDNIRTIDVLPKADQTRIMQEVLEIYAPLAYRLGVEKMRVEMEDLAFRLLHPKKYREIANFLDEDKEDREANVKDAIARIKSMSKGNVKIIRIKGRSKHIYSIYKKMSQRGVNLRQQYDLLGVRVIVDSIKGCYTLLGLLHEKLTPIEGRLKDYIANPKPNFYRSLHTAVSLPNSKIVEIQIRTQEMDEFAEEGVAAHWRYKGVKSDQFFEKKIGWLRGVLDLQKDNKEFLETAKVDVFGDKIYCYTPKGDVKEMPVGATILDFAFLIHEEVGCKAVGGRVNGKFVPLRHTLHVGDVVEIVTNKNQRPRRTWLKIVKSGRARQKIRKSLREHEKLAPIHYRQLKPIVTEEQGILVESSENENALCALAKCCHALPGDTIVGIATKRRVISVHRENCKLAVKESARWLPVNWKEGFNQKIRFFVDAEERSGLLADVLHTIASTRFEVKEAKAKLLDMAHAQCSFLVVPRDLDELKNLIKRVRKVRGVQRIYFE